MKTLHNAKDKQINFADERFYMIDEERFVPSVTHILDVYPKGFGFMQWLKDLGNNADEVVRRAAEQGSRIHNVIDMYLRGEIISWANESGNAMYSTEEWLMVAKFVEFWTTFKPTLIATEESLMSEKLGYGGTIDIVCKIGDKIWLIDTKTGNAIHKSHELQVAAYAMMWNEMYPEQKIDNTAIMHLKAMTRGADKAGKNIQGKGWQLKTFERNYNDAFIIFKHVQALWKEENPISKPKNLIYPDSFQLSNITK